MSGIDTLALKWYIWNVPAGSYRWLGWALGQLHRMQGGEKVIAGILTMLQTVTESSLNPWLRQNVGLEISQVELLAAHPERTELELKLTLRKTT